MAGGRFELAMEPTAIGLVSLNSNSETHMTAICDARLIYGRDVSEEQGWSLQVDQNHLLHLPHHETCASIVGACTMPICVLSNMALKMLGNPDSP